MKTIKLFVGISIIALLTGCSSSLPQSTPAEAMKSFYEARQEGKFEIVCKDFLDPYLLQRISGDLCVQFFQGQPISAGEITIDQTALDNAQSCSGFDVPSLYVSGPLINGQITGETWCMTQRNGKWLFGPVS